MRRFPLALLAMSVLGACRAAEPLRNSSAREMRLIALDSLARTHPCAVVHATVLFDASAWTRRQACAVAARALEILGAAPAHEPYMAPSDTARVAVLQVMRQRWCQFSGRPGTEPPGRMDALEYVVQIEIPDRPRFLGVAMDAQQFRGGAGFDAHPRGVWGGSPHLASPTEAPDTLEAGAPCGT